MIVLMLTLLGAGYGAWQARRRAGSRRDMAQYAAGHAILFAIAGMFLTILLAHLLA